MGAPLIPAALGAEDETLLAHLSDLARRSEGGTEVSGFLTGRQMRLCAWAAGRADFGERLFFYGGCALAERRCAVLLPPWLDFEGLPADPLDPAREAFLRTVMREEADGGVIREKITGVRLTGSGYHTLAHRDWLGALLASGIRREVLGDLAVLSNREAVTFAERKIAVFLVSELHRAGSDTVRAALWEAPEDFVLPRQYEPITGTVASPRLDGIVRALCNLSRSDAAELVTGGLVTLNDFICQSPDRDVCGGDVLSIRGYGKFVIDDVCGVTKKGRNRLAARKYQ